MQTLVTNTTSTNLPGFAAIPTRIHDLPSNDLKIGNANLTDPKVRAATLSSLSELATRLAEVHRTAAEAYLAQQCFAEALTHLEAATTFAPTNLEYLNQLGSIRYMQGDDKGAIGAFQRILESNPRQPDALFNLGMVRFGQGDHGGAEECFRRSLEVQPSNAEAWNNRGVCLFQLNRRDEAVQCFRRTLELEPANADAIANLQSI